MNYNEKEIEEEPEEDDASDDVTDRFLKKRDFPKNLDVEIKSGSALVRFKLSKLYTFLSKNGFSKEAAETKSLQLNKELKQEILNTLERMYIEKYSGGSFDKDFSNFYIGFSDLERQFLEALESGLSSLNEFDIDAGSEELWVAYGLLPEGHSDFEGELSDLSSFMFIDLSTQDDESVRPDLIALKESIEEKASNWIEYREPNFDSLQDLDVDQIISLAKSEFSALEEESEEIKKELERLYSISEDKEDPDKEDDASYRTSWDRDPQQPDGAVPDSIFDYEEGDEPHHLKHEEPVFDLDKFLESNFKEFE